MESPADTPDCECKHSVDVHELLHIAIIDNVDDESKLRLTWRFKCHRCRCRSLRIKDEEKKT